MTGRGSAIAASRALATALMANPLVTKPLAAAYARPKHTIRVLGTIVATLAVITAVAWGGVLWRSSVEQARENAVAAADSAVTALLSYNYQTVAQQVPDTQQLLTGQFKSDYAHLVNSALGPNAVRTQLRNKASVTASSVVSASPGHVVVLLFVNQHLQSPDGAQPEIAGSRIEVTLDKQGGKWLVSNIEPV
jgi:Mce-associated membrane protein